MSETITSILEEHRSFEPPSGHTGSIASLQDYHALCAEFAKDSDATWGRLANEHLDWSAPFTTVLNSQKAPFFRWFEDGKLNLSENCIDRHIAAGLGQRNAIIWESEAGLVRRISYNELLAEVCRAANTMRALGIEAGDRVIIYMPMIPEAAIAMLACSRIGAIHSVVFGAFSAQALRDRIEDTGARLVITADGGNRRGAIHALKGNVDTALSQGCASVEHVLVVAHAGNAVEMIPTRDIDWHDALNAQPDHCPALAVDAEHPLFILYSTLITLLTS